MIVFDQVTLVNRPVQLAVLTKGRFFPRGGELVTLYVGQSRIKRLLTGGDGYGYFTYTAAEAGLQTVSAVYGDSRKSGRLLVLSATEKLILIDIDTGLRESALTPSPRKGSRKALEALTKEFRVVYLHGLAGLTLSRQWIEASGLPPSVVLSGRNRTLVEALDRRGIRPHALIGSVDQVTAAEKTVRHRFSFEKAPNSRQVRGWEEVVGALAPGEPLEPE